MSVLKITYCTYSWSFPHWSWHHHQVPWLLLLQMFYSIWDISICPSIYYCVTMSLFGLFVQTWISLARVRTWRKFLYLVKPRYSFTARSRNLKIYDCGWYSILVTIFIIMYCTVCSTHAWLTQTHNVKFLKISEYIL